MHSLHNKGAWLSVIYMKCIRTFLPGELPRAKVKLTTRNISLISIILLVLSACSTEKNTSMTRFYHSFTARYNTYFNGHEAYKEGVAAQRDGNKDDYTDMLPFFSVSNKSTASLGKGNFTTAIEKSEKAIKNHSIKRKPKIDRTRRRTAKQKRILAKKEYNPFLKNAWLLLGMSQFHQGNFIEAASTFSYVCRLYAAEPDVLQESRAWLATCYSELGWYYDAEDIFRNKIGRDSVPRSARATLNAAYADFYSRQKRYDEALPYILRSIKHADGAISKARLYYLVAQIYDKQGERKNAYKYLSRVIRKSPPYEVQLNARIMQAEMASTGKAKSMISRLKRIAGKDKNKNYYDQIYYAIGNIHLASGDTTKAIAAYETGAGKSTRSGVEKGALLLRLGSIYYNRLDFTSARRCFSAAVGMISKERPDYDSISRLSKVIEELEPHTSVVFVQDSMQALAKMPADKQNEVFDKAIELAKKKIREERRKAAAEELRKNGGRANNAATASQDQSQNKSGKSTGGADSKWYFYNPPAVTSGKESFQRIWGNRPNEDNWRRSNKEVTQPTTTDEENGGGEVNDSTGVKGKTKTDTTQTKQEAGKDSVATGGGDKSKKGEKQDERLTREYYLQQLPLTDDQIAESNAKIAEALHKAGVIEKDKLENLPLAEKSLTRVFTQYPDYKQMNEVLYELFLLESQMGNKVEAQKYKDLLSSQYAQDKLTKIITDPNFEYDARYGRQTEDSLYRDAYEAYKRGDVAPIMRNAAVSATRFPDGDNRPRFMFLDAMANLKEGRRDAFLSELDTLIKKYPKEDITALAQSIYKGVKAGRDPGTGMFSIASLWERRSGGADAVLDSLAAAGQLSKERNIPFNVIIAYPADSVDQNELLYDVAKYNFTNFEVRRFEIEQTAQEGLGELIVKGFKNFDEAHSYVQMLYTEKSVQPKLVHTRIIVISTDNMQKLGVDYSIADYQKFYDKNFAPLKIKPDLMLDQQTDIYQSEDALPSESQQSDEQQDNNDDNEQDNQQNENNQDDGWYDLQ